MAIINVLITILMECVSRAGEALPRVSLFFAACELVKAVADHNLVETILLFPDYRHIIVEAVLTDKTRKIGDSLRRIIDDYLNEGKFHYKYKLK